MSYRIPAYRVTLVRDGSVPTEDLALTRKLVAAGQLLGVEVLDHVVTGDATNVWVSLKERGAL